DRRNFVSVLQDAPRFANTIQHLLASRAKRRILMLAFTFGILDVHDRRQIALIEILDSLDGGLRLQRRIDGPLAILRKAQEEVGAADKSRLLDFRPLAVEKAGVLLDTPIRLKDGEADPRFGLCLQPIRIGIRILDIGVEPEEQGRLVHSYLERAL